MFKWLDLFRKGQMVANPTAWKTGQITVAVLTPLILGSCSILKLVTGYELPIDEVLANQIALAVISIAGVVLTITTSEKVGLPAKVTVKEPPVPTVDPSDSARKILGGN